MKKCPLEEKNLFNPEEAARFYGLSLAKFRRLLECGECLPFLLFYRKRKSIVRNKFESFKTNNPQLIEHIKKDERRGRPKSTHKEAL